MNPATASLVDICMHRLRLSCLSMCAVWLVLGHTAAALGETPPRDALATAWLDDAMRIRARADSLNRVASAPLSLALGGALALGAPLGMDLFDTDAGAAASILSGALLATAAIGTWAHDDPDASQAWASSWASLGFAALSSALMLDAANRLGDDDSSQRMLPRLQFSQAAAALGFILTAFIFQQLMPAESAAALQFALRDRSPADQQRAVRAFLVRRERQRRVGTWLGAAWFIPLGGAPIYLAHDAATSGGREVMYVSGGVILGIGLTLVLYELLRTTDVERFDAGERPED